MFILIEILQEINSIYFDYTEIIFFYITLPAQVAFRNGYDTWTLLLIILWMQI